MQPGQLQVRTFCGSFVLMVTDSNVEKARLQNLVKTYGDNDEDQT